MFGFTRDHWKRLGIANGIVLTAAMAVVAAAGVVSMQFVTFMMSVTGIISLLLVPGGLIAITIAPSDHLPHKLHIGGMAATTCALSLVIGAAIGVFIASLYGFRLL